MKYAKSLLTGFCAMAAFIVLAAAGVFVWLEFRPPDGAGVIIGGGPIEMLAPLIFLAGFSGNSAV